MNRVNKLVLVLCLTLATSSCISWPTCCQFQKPEKSTIELLFDYRQRQILQLEQWKIKGRAAITQADEGWNVGLKWQQQKDNYQIKLEGPFAQGGVRLDGTAQSVILTLDDGQQKSADTAEALIGDVVGWKLPVSALRYWVRGIPYTEQTIDSIEYDDRGRITRLIQGEWDIEFIRYIPFETYSMPAKIFIKHPELTMKLIIADWSRP